MTEALLEAVLDGRSARGGAEAPPVKGGIQRSRHAARIDASPLGRLGDHHPCAAGKSSSAVPPLGVGTVAGAAGIDFTKFTSSTAYLRGTNFLLDNRDNALRRRERPQADEWDVQATGLRCGDTALSSVRRAGAMTHVIDATVPSHNTIVIGGGTVAIPVFSNGTSWTAHKREL
jgi:hypothetical protein